MATSTSNLPIPTISITLRLETVYCQFKQPEGIFSLTDNEKRISTTHLQLPKSGSLGTGVHFYATAKYFQKDTLLPTIVLYHVRLNIGDAYDSKSGIFKAPMSGVYNFFFQGFLDSGNFFRVALIKNDGDPFYFVFSPEKGSGKLGYTPRDPMIQDILELKRDDLLWLCFAFFTYWLGSKMKHTKTNVIRCVKQSTVPLLPNYYCIVLFYLKIL